MSRAELDELVEATPFVDTHEHLLEERTRLLPPGGPLYPTDDWAYMFWHYARDDLLSAGMPPPDVEVFLGRQATPREKWRLFAPWWSRTRHTGYMRAATISIERLCGMPLAEDTCEEISRLLRALRKPGYYRHVLRDVAGVSSSQVNSLESIFCETEYPDLLRQDLSFIQFSTADRGMLADAQRRFGIDGGASLGAYKTMIDAYFELFGPQAVAVKNQWAYSRRLLVEDVDEEAATPVFARLAQGEAVPEPDRAALEDHLFVHCIERATDMGLPVKLHTGYYATTGVMPLRRVRDNLVDMATLLARFPRTTFVLMHIGYPYQHEMLALAKQFPNAVVDLCWAWIIDPVSTRDFVKRFLVTAPHSKLLTFGGDYVAVENVVGHAHIARHGLARSLCDLVEDGNLDLESARELVPELMHGNAERIFPRPTSADRALDSPEP